MASAAYYQRNRENVLKAVREYALKNRDKILAKNKERYQKNREAIRAKAKINYKNNKEKFLKACHAYHIKNRDKILQKMKEKYHKNREYRIQKAKAYYQNNKAIVTEKARQERLLNRDKHIARAHAYRQANLERVHAYDRERSKRDHRDPIKRAKYDLWRRNNYHKVKESIRRRHEKAILTLGSRCAKCGYDERREILQFDHIDPATKIRKGKIRLCQDRWYGVLSRPGVFQLLCPNCHAKKTSLQLQSPDLSKNAEEYWIKRLGLIMEFGSCCAHCDYNENILALQFDHKYGLQGEKRQPAVVCVKNNPELFDLLCANCHVIKTLSERKKVLPETSGIPPEACHNKVVGIPSPLPALVSI